MKEYRDVLGKCKDVYSRMQDDISRELYEYSIMYSLTGDESFAYKKVMTVPEMVWLKAELEKHEGQRFLYGAGLRGDRITGGPPEYEWKGIIDSSREKVGSVLNGIPVMSAAQVLEQYEQPVVVVPVKDAFVEIKRYLLEEGFREDNIIDFSEKYSNILRSQYFSLPYLRHVENEVFVDCGAYDGESSLEFIRWSETYKKIFAFEPDEANYAECVDRLSNHCAEGRFSVIKKGTWSKAGTLSFESNGDEGSSISDTGNSTIEVATIDDVLETEKTTFIKMDIEGAELETLKGAANTIRKYMPKLAISVYHLWDDIFTIPEYILSLNEDYRFYLRHHSVGSWDTVLYALPKDWLV